MLKRFGLFTRNDVKDIIKAAMKEIPEWAAATAGVQSWDMPDYAGFQNQAGLYNVSSAIRAAVNLVPQIASSGGWAVMDGSEDDAQKLQNHPFTKVWNRPNPWHSNRSFVRDVVAFYMLTKNAYIWISSATPDAPPDELWVIPSHAIVPVPDERMYIKGYQYDPGDGRYLLLDPREVLHICGFNPLNMFVGSSDALPIAMTAEADKAAQRWNASFFKGNARLPGVLSFSDFVDDKPWGEIQRNIVSQAEKRNLLLLRGVGSGAVSYLNTGGTQKDMEFSTLRQQAWQEELMVYAPGLMSMIDPNATEANARTGKATVIDLVAQPLRDMLADEVNNKIMPRYNDGAVFIADDIRIADQILRLQEIQEYSRTHTVDEVRAKYWDDDPTSAGGDLLVNAAQSAPAEQAAPAISPMPAEVGNGQQADFQASASVRALVELDRWKAKSDRAGKLVTWHAIDLPAEVVEAVKSGAPWDKARAMLAPKSDALTLAESLNRLADAMAAK